MKVLLVDDDDALVEVLTQQLTVQNYIVDRVADGEMGWSYASTFDYDLIVLDWMLPQLDGLQLCQRLREEGYGVPILLLTAKDQQTEKIRGLEAGADDYLVKPFDIAELLVRIRVLMRRASNDTQSVLAWGNLCLDPASCVVTYQGRPVTLTAKEYALLELFLRHSHQVFSTQTLLDQIWSSDDFPSDATVRSHIRGLRQKLKTAGIADDVIETVRGLGYRLKTPNLAIARGSKSPQLSPPDHRANYLAGLTQAWQAHKGESVERWNYLVHLSQTLKQRSMSAQQRMQAKQMAHSLAGTLGTFGLVKGYRLALQIQQFLQLDQAATTVQTSQFQTLVTTLGHALDEPPQLTSWPEETSSHSPQILIVDINEAPYIQQLMALAIAQGFMAELAPSTDIAIQLLSEPPSSQNLQKSTASYPDLVLINLVGSETDPILDDASSHRLLQLITTLSQDWSHLPVLLITPQADFGNRLDLVRRGGAMVLEYPVSPTDVLDAIIQTTHLGYRHSKIMLVDDDSIYLQQMVKLLQPWHFQITPLANSNHFWTLFTQTLPDVIILDIEMPSINGFELCKVLRSHPKWQHLPIIFSSIHTDQSNKSKAFAVGADDYITKPIQGQDLVFRILNRLKRYRAWCSQEKATLA